jgi:hypothetical protein
MQKLYKLNNSIISNANNISITKAEFEKKKSFFFTKNNPKNPRNLNIFYDKGLECIDPYNSNNSNSNNNSLIDLIMFNVVKIQNFLELINDFLFDKFKYSIENNNDNNDKNDSNSKNRYSNEFFKGIFNIFFTKNSNRPISHSKGIIYIDISNINPQNDNIDISYFYYLIINKV